MDEYLNIDIKITKKKTKMYASLDDFNIYGVYMIRNDINKKIYIGSAINIRKRLKRHLTHLNNNIHHSIHLQRSWNKNGYSNFSFFLLKEIDSCNKTTKQLKNELLEIEQYFMDLFQSYDSLKGFNICKIAGNILGRKDSLETRMKKSIALSGKNAYWYGKSMPLTARQKLSKINTGKKLSSTVKNKISTILKELHAGEKNPMFGKKGADAPRSKPILQYDRNNTFIKKWVSIRDASINFSGNPESIRCSISNCCNGRNKTAIGFIWKFENQ